MHVLEVTLTWCCLSTQIPVGSVVIATVTAEDSHFTGETKWQRVRKSCCLSEIVCHMDLFKRDFKKKKVHFTHQSILQILSRETFWCLGMQRWWSYHLTDINTELSCVLNNDNDTSGITKNEVIQR